MYIVEKMVKVFLTSTKESFRLASKKIRIIGQGIPQSPSATVHPPLRSLRLLTVGRITPSKKLETLISAVKELSLIEPSLPVNLSIVGEPVKESDHEYLDRLHHMVDEKGLNQIINFVGAVPYLKLGDVYSHHDIFIHAGATGSLDKVVLEALAYNEIVISSNDATVFLNEKMRYPHGDARALADRIIYWHRQLSDGLYDPEPMRCYVMENHGLRRLITRILEFFV
jgi:glycosyltransferase involved in cell wall biosynthesis